jgi:hypothetical protein
MLIVLFSGFLGNAQTGNKTKLEAYYFHNATRCVTCKTVESEAKTILKELYGDNITFQSLNLEDKTTKELAKKLKVSGQTLLVVNGSKKVNLTNDGFCMQLPIPTNSNL